MPSESGYAPTGEPRYSEAHVDALPPAPPTPSGVTVAPFTEAGPEPVYLVDAQSVLDEPGEFASDKLEYDYAYTSNDKVNAPMLAINGWLGYRPVGTGVSCVRQLWRVIVRGA
jgi:hypothetical protein